MSEGKNIDTAQLRGAHHSHAEKMPIIAGSIPGDDADEDRCSYEEQRDRRVARMRQMMEPLVQASKTYLTTLISQRASRV